MIYWILRLLGAYIGLLLGMRLLAYALNAMARRTRERSERKLELQRVLLDASMRKLRA